MPPDVYRCARLALGGLLHAVAVDSMGDHLSIQCSIGEGSLIGGLASFSEGLEHAGARELEGTPQVCAPR